MSSEELRVVFYSHDSQGLGHTRRNVAVAHSLAQNLLGLTGRSVTGLLLTGVDTAASHDKPDAFDWVVLPGVVKGSHSYGPRNLLVDMERLTKVRSALIEAALLDFQPHLVVVDRHPWGIGRELEGPLRKMRANFPDTRIVLGLREVLDAPGVAAKEWEKVGDVKDFRHVYDHIWVYGDQAVHDPLATGEIPAEFKDMVQYTGYLAAGRPVGMRTSGVSCPYIVSMAGGGSDGLQLLTTAARARVPHGYNHLVITGPQMPAEQVQNIRSVAHERTTVVTAVPDALVEVMTADAVISMGGYNSTTEILTTNTPALIVPRESPRVEQLIRAKALEKVGAVEVLRMDELTPQAISAWMRGAVGTVRFRHHLDLAGLQTVAQLVAQLLETQDSLQGVVPS